MRLVIDIDFYDYFGGANKHTYKTFDSIVEGYKEFKRVSSTDFIYDDGYQNTTCRLIDSVPVVTAQRPHARSASEWLKLKASIPAIVVPVPVDDLDDGFDAPFGDLDDDPFGDMDDDSLPF